MSDMGTERVEATFRVPERVSNQPQREPAARPRRPPPSSSEAADEPELPEHEVDSLA